MIEHKNKPVSVKKAVLLNAAAKYSTVILQLIYTAILARILTPEDYGTIAVINVFIVFFQLLADMGLGTGVIQNKDLTDDDVNNIYSFSIYMGLVLLVIFMGCSFLIASIYGDTIYIPLGFILSFSLMFNAFNMIPNAILLKEKKFSSIAIRTVVVAVVSFSLTIVFAVRGMGVYAFAAQSVVYSMGLFLWNECKIKLKLNLKPKFSSVKKIFGYSIYQFGAQTLNYFNRNLDNLLIGKFFSKEDLGYYNKAYTLMQYPINYLPGVITPVLHPILSEHQDNKKFIYEKYMQLLKVLSLLGCFGSAFCFFAGKEIILIAFGQQWGNAIQTFRILSLSLWPQILTNTIAPIYQSIGNTKLMFQNLIITTIIIVSMIIAGVVMHSILYISIFVSFAYVLNFFVTYFIMMKFGMRASYSKFLFAFRHELIIFIFLMLLSVLWPIRFENILLGFVIKFVAMISLYVVLLVVTKQHRTLLKFIKR